MRTILIEDEPLVARDLQKLIQQVAPDVELVAVLGSLAEANAWLDANPMPDLAFMDIQLSDGVSFQLFDTREFTCPVIFTTAFHEYAVRAFKVNSVDYLLKPIAADDLTAALDKYRRLYQSGNAPNMQAQIARLITQMRSTNNAYKQRFMVHAKGGLMPLDANEVACFLKDELVYVLTLSGTRHFTDYNTMDEVEHLLDPAVFFRANRQFIINLKAVDTFKAGLNGKLNVRLKPPLPTVDVSREKAAAFKEWLEGAVV